MTEQRKEYLRRWRAKNKERINAMHRELRAKNKERYKQYQIKYWRKRLNMEDSDD